MVTPTIGLVTDGYSAKGVAVAVSNKLTPMVIEVTPVNKWSKFFKLNKHVVCGTNH